MIKYRCVRTVVEHLTVDEMFNLLSKENPGPIKFWAKWLGDLSLEYRGNMKYVGIGHERLIQDLKDSMAGKTVDLSSRGNDIISLQNVIILRGHDLWCPVSSLRELKEYFRVVTKWQKFRCKEMVE